MVSKCIGIRYRQREGRRWLTIDPDDRRRRTANRGGVLNAPNVIMRALGKYYGVGGVCGDDTTIVVDPFSVRGSLPDNSIIRYCRAEWQVVIYGVHIRDALPLPKHAPLSRLLNSEKEDDYDDDDDDDDDDDVKCLLSFGKYRRMCTEAWRVLIRQKEGTLA
ncbi:hypothetical protein V1478_013953 [Vespula squamosa]|uniref:Uncharacterized protein n=1 Tax=Vespula squamosa TaxID=30214 RepID=A0ABD2A6Y0_VESSQ